MLNNLIILCSDSANEIPDITHRLQKLREKELRNIRQQNMILDYKLKQQQQLENE
jgi:hypothetical protein